MSLNEKAITQLLTKWFSGEAVWEARHVNIEKCVKEIVAAAQSKVGHKVCLSDLRKGDIVEMENHPAGIKRGEVLYIYNGQPSLYIFALIKDNQGRLHTLQPHMTGTVLVHRRD
jgi:hypothetical protein